MPSPSAWPRLLLPAIVVTTPWGVTSRTRSFPVSATMISPLGDTTATPCGPAKLAAEPTPSMNAELPLPARVDTMPSGVIRRILWFVVSATTVLPFVGDTATPLGELKQASAPSPSAKAA